jgi:hypothetical protein
MENSPPQNDGLPGRDRLLFFTAFYCFHRASNISTIAYCLVMHASTVMVGGIHPRAQPRAQPDSPSYSDSLVMHRGARILNPPICTRIQHTQPCTSPHPTLDRISLHATATATLALHSKSVDPRDIRNTLPHPNLSPSSPYKTLSLVIPPSTQLCYLLLCNSTTS